MNLVRLIGIGTGWWLWMYKRCLKRYSFFENCLLADCSCLLFSFPVWPFSAESSIASATIEHGIDPVAAPPRANKGFAIIWAIFSNIRRSSLLDFGDYHFYLDLVVQNITSSYYIAVVRVDILSTFQTSGQSTHLQLRPLFWDTEKMNLHSSLIRVRLLNVFETKFLVHLRTRPWDVIRWKWGTPASRAARATFST